jgi:hypothetical protein
MSETVGYTGVKSESVLTSTSLHALLLCPEVVAVTVTAPKFEFCALARGRIIAPPGQQGPAVASHGWQTAHILCHTRKAETEPYKLLTKV